MDSADSIVLPRKAKDLAGIQVGRLTVIRCVGRSKHRAMLWECTCACGSVTVVSANRIVERVTQSCGCLQRDQIRQLGKSRAKHDGCELPEMKTWDSMIRRCHNPQSKDYARYGGRGISVCDRWRESCRQFVDDVGSRPSGRHQIDRINNDGNYEPGNCRWVLPRDNSLNRRSTVWITCDGVTRCASEWAELYGIPRTTLLWRIKHGWSSERAIQTPVNIKHGAH